MSSNNNPKNNNPKNNNPKNHNPNYPHYIYSNQYPSYYDDQLGGFNTFGQARSVYQHPPYTFRPFGPLNQSSTSAQLGEYGQVRNVYQPPPPYTYGNVPLPLDQSSQAPLKIPSREASQRVPRRNDHFSSHVVDQQQYQVLSPPPGLNPEPAVNNISYYDPYQQYRVLSPPPRLPEPTVSNISYYDPYQPYQPYQQYGTYGSISMDSSNVHQVADNASSNPISHYCDPSVLQSEQSAPAAGLDVSRMTSVAPAVTSSRVSPRSSSQSGNIRNNDETTQLLEQIIRENERLQLELKSTKESRSSSLESVRAAYKSQTALLMKRQISNEGHKNTISQLQQKIQELESIEKERNQFNQNSVPPNEFTCPITYEVMNDPVICADGSTYERTVIQQWLVAHNTSPKTNAILANKKLIPNISLRVLINEWKSSNGLSIENVRYDDSSNNYYDNDNDNDNDIGDDDNEINERYIALVISQTNCTRAEAIQALRNNDNDLVNAIMELSM